MAPSPHSPVDVGFRAVVHIRAIVTEQQADFSGLGQPVVDCDLHNTVPSLRALYPYLEEHWVAYCSESGFDGPGSNDYPGGATSSAIPGSKPDSGPPGSNLELLQAQVLDPWQVEVGILTCSYQVQSLHNEDLAAALATAINQWQIDEWLERDPRLRASLVVPSQHPARAAEEIERCGDHPGFVQVIVPVRSYLLYGRQISDPLLQAATRHDLPLAIHAGGAPGIPPSGAGWPSTHVEQYSLMAQVFQSQLASLVMDGAFARFPDLRVVLVESGFNWLPAWMWRLDKEWKGLRRETPWVKRRPSDYMRDHVRLTLQPLDAPADPRQLLDVIGQLESDEMLMFSTDYPHRHFDRPEDAVPRGLSSGQESRILRDNARAFYHL